MKKWFQWLPTPTSNTSFAKVPDLDVLTKVENDNVADLSLAEVSDLDAMTGSSCTIVEGGANEAEWNEVSKTLAPFADSSNEEKVQDLRGTAVQEIQPGTATWTEEDPTDIQGLWDEMLTLYRSNAMSWLDNGYRGKVDDRYVNDDVSDTASQAPIKFAFF